VFASPDSRFKRDKTSFISANVSSEHVGCREQTSAGSVGIRLLQRSWPPAMVIDDVVPARHRTVVCLHGLLGPQEDDPVDQGGLGTLPAFPPWTFPCALRACRGSEPRSNGKQPSRPRDACPARLVAGQLPSPAATFSRAPRRRGEAYMPYLAPMSYPWPGWSCSRVGSHSWLLPHPSETLPGARRSVEWHQLTPSPHPC
jgi:hypothetical protein